MAIKAPDTASPLDLILDISQPEQDAILGRPTNLTAYGGGSIAGGKGGIVNPIRISKTSLQLCYPGDSLDITAANGCAVSSLSGIDIKNRGTLNVTASSGEAACCSPQVSLKAPQT